MNELNKLIEQWAKENDYPEESAVREFHQNIRHLQEFNGDGDWMLTIVEWLASRPTCGKEQRLFLDQLEDMGVIDDKVFAEYKIDIDKVINGE